MLLQRLAYAMPGMPAPESMITSRCVDTPTQAVTGSKYEAQSLQTDHKVSVLLNVSTIS